MKCHCCQLFSPEASQVQEMTLELDDQGVLINDNDGNFVYSWEKRDNEQF